MNISLSAAFHRKTKVSILATYKLVRDSLSALLELDRDLMVLDIIGTADELLQKVSKNKPDVVLLCLLNNEGKHIEIVSDLVKIIPEAKVVVLHSPNSLLDQTAALKLGVSGMVTTNQNFRVLSRALKQVSEGEVWLNQKLIAQLLNNNFNQISKVPKKKGLYNDDLTNREQEVVAMIGLGLKNKAISKRLFISEATVRHHLSSIYSKLNIEDRLNLAIYAHRQNIVQPFSRTMQASA